MKTPYIRCPNCLRKIENPEGLTNCPHCGKTLINSRGKRKDSIYSLISIMIAGAAIGLVLGYYLSSSFISGNWNDYNPIFAIVCGSIGAFFSIDFTFFAFFQNERYSHKLLGFIVLAISLAILIPGIVLFV